MVDGVAQRPQCELRVHGGQAAPPQVVLAVLRGQHAAARPGAPGDGGAGQAAGPPVLHEGVEVGVGRGVRGLVAAAPDAGDRGERHERFEGGAVEQFVQVGRAVRLGPQDVREFGEARVAQGDGVDDTGGVHDGGDGVGGEQCRERVPVRDVAGHHGGFRAQSGQFRREFRRPGGVRAAAAGQHQVPGAASGEHAGHPGAECAGAAGDEDRSLGAPLGGRGAGTEGCGGQASYEGPGAPHHDLVLRAVGEQRGEPGAGPSVEPLGEIDQSAPGARELECRGAAEAPQLRLGRGDGPVGAADRGGAAGGRPQRCVDSGRVQRLDEHDRGGEAGGESRVAGVGVLVESGQRQDSGESVGGGLVQPVRDGPGVGVVRRVEDEDAHVGAARAQGRPDGGGVVAAVLSGGQYQQPGAVEGAVREVGEGLPGGAVAPAVHDVPVPPLAAPGGERGQDGLYDVGGQVQRVRDGRQVLALDGGPEGGVVGASGVGRHGEGVEPVAFPLEGVGRQVGAHAAQPVQHPAPVDGGAVRMGGGRQAQQGLGLGAARTQGGEEGDALAVGQAVLRHGGEDAVGAEFEIRRDALGVEGGDAVGEPYRLADVPHPVLGGPDLVGVREPSGDVGDDRDAG